MRRLLVAFGLLGLAGAGSLFALRSPTAEAPILAAATKGSFRIVLREEGEFKAARNVEIRVNLEAYQEDLIVRRVVPEGTHVQSGDLLIEFDESKLRLEIEQRENTVEIRRKDLATADEDLKIAALERTFQIDDATSLIRTAHEDLAKYDGIEGPRLRKEAEVALSRAESLAVEKARIEAETAKMAAKGIASEFELRKAQQEARDAAADREIAALALKQWVEFDQPQGLRRRQAAVAEKQLLLETRRQSCEAKVAQKESARLGIRLDLQRKEAELATLRRDLERLRLHAPVAGFVVYGNPNDNPWHSRSDDLVLKEGAKVYPRRTLMTIPDLSVFKIAMQINERDIGKVKLGQATAIEAAALPGMAFAGAIDRIAQMASPQRQWYPQDNSFEVESTVSPHEPRIKPGMKCKVAILVEEVQDVLVLPRVALHERDGAFHCLRPTQPPAERPVRIGRSNDEFVEILEGVSAGDSVLLAVKAREK